MSKHGHITKPGRWSCPRCQMKLDGYVSFDNPDAQPAEGDLTVCSYCRVGLQFTERGFKFLEPKAFEKLSEDEKNGLLKMGFVLDQVKAPIFDPITGRARN
jgi:hypothetical protein